ncbi:carboxypeptidase regulatory-like domain-containing protein [Chloroflexota bacterium]
MHTRTRWACLLVAGLLPLALLWFSTTANSTITGLRNILQYHAVEAFGGARVRAGEPPGAIAGTVRDVAGNPISGAVVLVASSMGHTYTAESDSAGNYRIGNVPPGRYVPVSGKRGFGQAFSEQSAGALRRKPTLTVRPGSESQGIGFALSPAKPLPIAVDDSLIISLTMAVEVRAPFPGRAQRTNFSFERAGLRVNDCWLYEPVESEGEGLPAVSRVEPPAVRTAESPVVSGVEPLPTMLLVLPGPVMNWEIVPVPFAAEGYSVLACYPLRGIDIDEDAADLLTALEYLRQGAIPSRADTDQIVLVGASFTSLHSWRLLGLTDEVDVTLVLGGMADGFSFRHDVETGTVHARPPFDQVLMALGFPNTSPELYFKYSILYHLEGLPPACLLHGRDDELVPFNQGVLLSAEMTRRGMRHESYAYDGLKHYFSTDADNETTQQMWRDSLDCLRNFLASRQ